jgi:hypothetical protein
MASQPKIEERVALLEHEVARLKAKLDERTDRGSWVDDVSGAFEGDEGFREILRLGKELRDAEQAEDSP